jgi:4-carboxymuconolactone decarboxylase
MDRIAQGAALRRQVVGAEYTDPGDKLADQDPFFRNFRDFTVEHCWANVWLRPGLSLKTRSMLNLAMLTVAGRFDELAIHTRGALNNGVTEEEIAEILLQAGVYGGVPVAAEGFKVTHKVVLEYREKARAAKT